MTQIIICKRSCCSNRGEPPPVNLKSFFDLEPAMTPRNLPRPDSHNHSWASEKENTRKSYCFRMTKHTNRAHPSEALLSYLDNLHKWKTTETFWPAYTVKLVAPENQVTPYSVTFSLVSPVWRQNKMHLFFLELYIIINIIM